MSTHPFTLALSNNETHLDSSIGTPTTSWANATIGGDYIGVTENGDFRPCGFHEGYRLGNIKDQGLKETWAALQKSTCT